MSHVQRLPTPGLDQLHSCGGFFWQQSPWSYHFPLLKMGMLGSAGPSVESTATRWMSDKLGQLQRKVGSPPLCPLSMVSLLLQRKLVRAVMMCSIVKEFLNLLPSRKHKCSWLLSSSTRLRKSGSSGYGSVIDMPNLCNHAFTYLQPCWMFLQLLEIGKCYCS